MYWWNTFECHMTYSCPVRLKNDNSRLTLLGELWGTYFKYFVQSWLYCILGLGHRSYSSFTIHLALSCRIPRSHPSRSMLCHIKSACLLPRRYMRENMWSCGILLNTTKVLQNHFSHVDYVICSIKLYKLYKPLGHTPFVHWPSDSRSGQKSIGYHLVTATTVLVPYPGTLNVTIMMT